MFFKILDDGISLKSFVSSLQSTALSVVDGEDAAVYFKKGDNDMDSPKSFMSSLQFTVVSVVDGKDAAVLFLKKKDKGVDYPKLFM